MLTDKDFLDPTTKLTDQDMLAPVKPVKTAKETPKPAKALPPRGFTERLTDAFKAGVQGDNFIGRTSLWLADKTDLGKSAIRKAYPGKSEQFYENLQEKLLRQTQRKIREDYAARQKADPAWRPDESWLRNLTSGRVVADILGSLPAEAGPEMLVNPGRTVAGRIAAQMGLSGTADLGYQKVAQAQGVRDEYDPVETGVSALLGGGFQGALEGARGVVRALRGPRDTPEVSLRQEEPQTPPSPSTSDPGPVPAPTASSATPDQPPNPDDVVNRLTAALKTAGKALPEQKKLYAEERGKRFAQVAAAQAEGGGQKALDRSLAALAGELPKADFESVADQFTPAEVDSLFDSISSSNISPGSKLSAQQGLRRLLNGQLPQPRQLEHMSAVFPPDFIKTAIAKRKVLSSDGLFGEIWNAPKSLQSTADLSGPMRQGLGLIHRGEFWKSLAPMVKAAFDPKTSKALETSITSHPNYDLARDAGLSLTTSTPGGVNEDMFRSHLAEKIPVWGKVVQGSERAYVGFLNKLRFDTFNAMLEEAKAINPGDNPAVAEGISRYINVMTGRGGLGSLEKNVKELNNVLYSPGLISSRLQILTAPIQALTGKGFIADLPEGLRKEAAKSYAGIVGVNALALTLATAAGLDVNLDPRSSDFLKAKDGNTRLDFGGGLLQYITLAARTITRETTSGDKTREMKGPGQTPLDNTLRFVMNKLHPSLTLILDQQRGKTAVGEPFEWEKAIISRLTPMGFPDIADTLKEQGSNPGVMYALLGLIGVGLQNYQARGDGPKLTDSDFTPAPTADANPGIPTPAVEMPSTTTLTDNDFI